MKMRKNIIIASAFAAIACAFSNVAAFGQNERTPSQVSLYGMHFITGGQTMRIAAQNPRVFDSEIQPCIKVRAVFDVYEAAGDGSVRLRFVRRVSREVELDPGEGATFEFASNRNGDWVSPAVFANCEENCPADPSGTIFLPTVSIRQGGSTVLLLPAVLKGFDPQPDPPASRAQ